MEKENNWDEELSKYVKDETNDESEKAKIWETAIGLQDVDGLKPSKYLVDTAKEHIEGKIDINEASNRINEYYKEKGNENHECEEADKVSLRITELLSEKAFSFSTIELLNIHKRLFDGILDNAGEYRNYNITKKEWILNGDTVIYASFDNIAKLLEYDFEQERNFSYNNLSLDQAIKHLSRFISNIWQIHPFCEGNTRTTAIFLIKYLRTFGFNINNTVFAKNSWYFRNSLVRANYTNFEKNIFETTIFLERFMYNLLSDTKYELKNRYTHIDYINNDKNDDNINISLIEQAILNILRNNSNITQEEIAKSINKSVRLVKEYMSSMQQKGLISRINGKKYAKWVINK